MNKVKRFRSLYCLLIALTLCAVGIFALNFAKVKADEEDETTTATTEKIANANEFWLESGADVYINDDNANDYMGIRFTAKISESYLNSVSANAQTVRYWIIIAPAYKVDNNAANLSLENYASVNAKIVSATGDLQTDSDGNKFYRGSVKYDFADSEWTAEKQQAMIDLPLVARPCLAITDDEGNESVIYANLNGAPAKVMRNIADAALADVAEKSESTSGKIYLANQNQLDMLLSYVKQEDVNAYHATDSVQSQNLALIDNTTLKDYKVYKTRASEEGATFVKIGSMESDNYEKITLGETTIFNDIAVGTDVAIYLSNGTDFIKTTAKQITKVIYDANDLQLFNFDGLTTETDFTSKQIKGSYVLANDIVDTETVYNEQSPYYQYAYGGKSLEWKTVSTVGFYGTFDGLGHSLTIKTKAGLFPAIMDKNVTIKNVEFKNCTVIPLEGQNNSVIGKVERVGVTFENISISLTQDTYTSFATTKPTSDNQGYTLYILPTSNTESGNPLYKYNAKNIVFKCDYDKIPTAESTISNRSITFDFALNSASNVYVLEANKSEDETYALSLNVNSSNVTKFGSYSEIREYFASEDGQKAFATFSKDWSMEKQGYPIWASSYNALDYVEYLGTGIFSGWDNDSRKTDGFTTYENNDDQMLPSNLKFEGNVTGVYLVEDVNTDSDFTTENNLYTNGKVKITHTGASQIEYKNIYIKNDTNKIYKATLEIYTRIINSKEDLRLFDLDEISAEGRLITGYYILGSDIVDTEETYNGTHILDTYNSISGDKLAWGAFAGATGFSGVFDGRGHTLTIKTGTGLFGDSMKSGSVIKNVNFKDCTIVKNDRYGSVLGGAGNPAITVENIFISLAEETYKNYAEDDKIGNLYVLMYQTSDTPLVTAKNVIFELDYGKMPKADKTSEKKYIIFINKLAEGNSFGYSTEGVYVVKLNYDATAKYAREFKAIEDETNNKGSVSVYESYEALKAYFEGKDGKAALAKFENDCWDITNGYPVWKNSTTVEDTATEEGSSNTEGSEETQE